MKFLNLGCGTNYSTLKEWTNVDFVSTGEGVIAHNLISGIPFGDNSFDLVYHSHVLEHFSKEDAEIFVSECLRVLKPAGILRIAVPDLEKITRNYLQFLEKGLNDPSNEMTRLNYDWTLLEMYDQTVRNISGGNMAAYLFQNNIKNEAFVYERIGEEGRALRRLFHSQKKTEVGVHFSETNKMYKEHIFNKIKRFIKAYLFRKLHIEGKAMAIGKFRLEGEIHQWMYDRYSLSNLLAKKGGTNIEVRDAFTSFINNWNYYNLDSNEGLVRKPDSLFMEAIK